jgi:uncharacterized protein YhdP
MQEGEDEYPLWGLVSSFAGGRIKVWRGSLHFVDESVAPRPITTRLENLYVELGSISRDAPIPFDVKARQPNPKGPDGSVSIVGKLFPLLGSLEWSKIRIAAEVQGKNLNPLPFWPYYGSKVPINGIGGSLDIDAQYEGNFRGLFRSWGQIKVRDVALDYSQVFGTVLKPKTFVVDYDVRLTRRSLIIPEVTFRLPEIEIRGRCALHEIRSRSRRIEAFASTGSFRLDEIKQYLPFRIVSPELGAIWNEVTRRGEGRIVSVRIGGPITDFSKLEDPKKADLIYGKMRLDGVTFPFARDFQPLENISGWVTLEEGSFRFQDLKGSYGKSTLNATEMMISRVYSSPRLNLTLDGEINLKGAMDMAKPGGFLEKGIPVEDMSGKGDLRLKISVSLKGPSKLSYDGHLHLKGARLTIKKVHLPVAAVSGEVAFSNDRCRFIGLKGKLGKSAFGISGQVENPWPGEPGRQRLNLTLRGEFDLGEWFSRFLPVVSPGISKAMTSFSDISGAARLTLELKGRGTGLKGIRYKGKVSLREATFRHRRMASLVRFSKGEVRFTSKVIRLSGMDARLKGSNLRIEGSVRDYLVWKRSKIDLRIRAQHLDIGDFEFKSETRGEWIWKDEITLPEFGWVTLRVERGKWRHTEFSDGTADISLAKGRLTLERFHCDLRGGKLDATAWLDLALKGEMAFALNPTLSHGDASRFFKDFGLQERLWITGGFNLGGSLMGRGSNGKEIRRSLEGKLRVEMEKGRIRRWRILSKVFSVFNVLQLFRGRLPELRGEGMPYKRITADIGITHGIVRTDNLLVDSDAMRITVIGEADVADENLDVTMGLCPLGTVDAIISNVPVVGRILTGEDEAVIAYYVEVKGDFSNPKVKHIPLKSMERGLLGMIKRVLETPIHVIPMTKEWAESGGDESIPFPEDEDEDVSQ